MTILQTWPLGFQGLVVKKATFVVNFSTGLVGKAAPVAARDFGFHVIDVVFSTSGESSSEVVAVVGATNSVGDHLFLTSIDAPDAAVVVTTVLLGH